MPASPKTHSTNAHDAQKSKNSVHVPPVRKYLLQGGQGKIVADDNPFLEDKAIMQMPASSEQKRNWDKGKGVDEDENVLMANTPKYLLAKLTKHVTQLDYGVVETYHCFKVLNKGNARTAITFHALCEWKITIMTS